MTSKIFLEVKKEIEDHLPSWQVKSEGKEIVIEGNFELRNDNTVIDRFDVRIRLDELFPDSLPVVWETGGKIPKTGERHVNGGDDSLCLFVYEERWKFWDAHRSIAKFIFGPLRNYFLSQAYFDLTKKWIFGERRHDLEGILDFYQEALDLDDENKVLQLLLAAISSVPNDSDPCPCRSSLPFRDCHYAPLKLLKSRVSLERIEGVVARLQREHIR